MLYQKLLLLEQKIIRDRHTAEQKMVVLNDIKIYLSGLSIGSEVLIGLEQNKFIELLEDLKGKSLTVAERKMLLELNEVTQQLGNDGYSQ
ncbi:hypothetical protein [Aureitalea marina]|uniref:Uncharacterized protein n=1 Tax=Aureitalea marina TaxID=930804 RepID=A0A2S7KNI5_9FLAO|nr:hypothetical protein [Aureitalea marina]PQB04182.1 hypothetical protein BST85_04145 [Aureitalea marina]